MAAEATKETVAVMVHKVDLKDMVSREGPWAGKVDMMNMVNSKIMVKTEDMVARKADTVDSRAVEDTASMAVIEDSKVVSEVTVAMDRADTENRKIITRTMASAAAVKAVMVVLAVTANKAATGATRAVIGATRAAREVGDNKVAAGVTRAAAMATRVHNTGVSRAAMASKMKMNNSGNVSMANGTKTIMMTMMTTV